MVGCVGAAVVFAVLSEGLLAFDWLDKGLSPVNRLLRVLLEQLQIAFLDFLRFLDNFFLVFLVRFSNGQESLYILVDHSDVEEELERVVAERL